MRPNWQVFLTRELAARAGNTAESHMVGGLVVRQLLADNPGLDTAMLTVPQATQQEFTTGGGNDVPELIDAMKYVWTALDVPTAVDATKSKVEIADGLWTLARVAYLSLPTQEIEAARELAKRSAPLPWYGATIQKTDEGTTEEQWGTEESWQEDDSGWTGDWSGTGALGGLSGVLGGFGSGFGSLRSELYDNTPEANRSDVMALYDLLASNTTQRRTYVRKWQEWAKGRGKYTGAIDGLWGPLSETAWLAFVPTSYAQPTKLTDLAALRFGDYDLTAILAAGIARDKWVSANPDRLPPPPAVPTPDSSPARVDAEPKPPTEPLPTEPTVTITPVEEEEIVVAPEESEGIRVPTSDEAASVPVSEPGSDVTHVTIVPVVEGDGPEPRTVSKRSALVPVLAVLGVGAVVVGAMAWGKKKPAYEEG